MLLSEARRVSGASMSDAGVLAEDPSYREACRRVARARPHLAERAPAASLLNVQRPTLLHAGPPVPAQAAPSPRLRRALVAAARREGMAASDDEAAAMLAGRAIALRSAQDFGVVTALDQVIGPSTTLLRLSDRAGAGLDCFAPDALVTEAPAIGKDVAPLSTCGIDAPDWLALAAIKCSISAAGHINDCPVVTDLGSNGSDVGLKISGLPTSWIATDSFWFRRRFRALRQADAGVLAVGDALVRHLLDGPAGPNQPRPKPLNAADWLLGRAATPAALRDVPGSLFTGAMANFRRTKWFLFIQPF
jgi:hypothetical protein